MHGKLNLNYNHLHWIEFKLIITYNAWYMGGFFSEFQVAVGDSDGNLQCFGIRKGEVQVSVIVIAI